MNMKAPVLLPHAGAAGTKAVLGSECLRHEVRSDHRLLVLSRTIFEDVLDPSEKTTAYLDGMMKKPEDFVLIANGLWRNVYTTCATKAGFSITQEGTNKIIKTGSLFNYKDAVEKKGFFQKIGLSRVAGSIRTKATSVKGKKGYLVQIPVMPPRNLFHREALKSDFLELKPGTTGLTGTRAGTNKARNGMFRNLMGVGASAAVKSVLTLNQPFVGRVDDVESALSKKSWQNPDKLGSLEVLSHLKNHIVGFTLFAPPVKNSENYTDADYAYPTMSNGIFPTVQDVKDPEDLLGWALSVRIFTATVDLFIPQEVGEYITQQKGEVSIANLATWFMLYYMGNYSNSHVYPVRAMTSLSSLRERNKRAPSNRARVVNDRNLALNYLGDPVFVPELDNINEYEKTFADLGAQEDKSFCLADPTKLNGNEFTYGETRADKAAAVKTFPENIPIYADFSNYKFSYSNEEGFSTVEDMEQWKPMNSTHAMHFFTSSILTEDSLAVGYSDVIAHTITARCSLMGMSPTKYFDARSKELRDAGMQEYQIVRLRNVCTDFSSYRETLAYAADTITLGGTEAGVVRSEDYKFRHLFDPALPGLTWVGDMLKDFTNSVYSLKPEEVRKLLSGRNVSNSMSELGVVLCFGVYGPKLKETEAEDLKARDVYLNPVLNADHKAAPLPSVQANRALFPHQVKIDNFLSNNRPQFTVLSADPGAGKTLAVLRDIVLRVHKGEIHRPLIIGPTKLIRHYLEDAAYMFGGLLNMIPITTAILNRYGADGLLAMVKGAPRNSVLLTSYKFLAGNTYKVFYNTTEIELSKNEELLRSMKPDKVYEDESHNLRNDNLGTRATRRLTNDIPEVCLATGTLVNKQLTDVVNQIGMFDPSIFGSVDYFLETYAEEYRGQTILSLKDGAAKAVSKRISEHTMLIQCKRKEWAAILPERNEAIWPCPVDKNGGWYRLYLAILREAIEEIKGKDKDLIKELESSDDKSDEEEQALELDLKPYIARLERFLIAPEHDEAAHVLKGKDLVGPKIPVVNQIIREHYTKKIPGKILIFTQYINSASSVYEHLLPEFKKAAILYRPSTSAQDLAQFARNDQKRILIGTEETLKEGLNLQIATRLIRIETCWTPGNLEQSMSRIYRPDPKKLASGKVGEIFIDHLVANFTIDVTKLARLISRILIKTQFDEAENPMFNELDSLPLVNMTLANIESENDFQTVMLPYGQAYKKYQQLVKADLEDYRDDPRNKLVIQPIAASKTGIKDAAILSNVPYIPDMVIPFQTQLGLIPMSDWINDHGKGATLGDFDATGLRVHTEFGDGIVTRSTGATLHVEIPLKGGSSKKKIVAKLSAFVITDKNRKGSVRKALAELEHLPYVATKKPAAEKTEAEEEAPIVKKTLPVVPVKTVPVKTAPVSEKDAFEGEITKLAGKVVIDIDLESVYDMLALSLFNDEAPVTSKQKAALLAAGFKTSGPYLSAKIDNKVRYDKFLAKLYDSFDVQPQYKRVLETMRVAFKGGEAKTFVAHQALSSDYRNFWKMSSNTAGKNEVRPYPIVWNGEFLIAFRSVGQPAVKKLRALVQVPGVKWHVNDDHLLLFCSTKQDVINKIRKLEKLGFTVSRPKALMESLREVRMVPLKKPKPTEVKK